MTEEIALFFHLLGAFVVVAGIAVAGVAHAAARRRERPDEIALLLGLARAGVVLSAPVPLRSSASASGSSTSATTASTSPG